MGCFQIEREQLGPRSKDLADAWRADSAVTRFEIQPAINNRFRNRFRDLLQNASPAATQRIAVENGPPGRHVRNRIPIQWSSKRSPSGPSTDALPELSMIIGFDAACS